jgi:hypothetical protein
LKSPYQTNIEGRGKAKKPKEKKRKRMSSGCEGEERDA